jgi:hypothetical protein
MPGADSAEENGVGWSTREHELSMFERFSDWVRRVPVSSRVPVPPHWSPLDRSRGANDRLGLTTGFTVRARRVPVFAQKEAWRLHHNFIGSEHLRLGLIHEGEGVAAEALVSLGITVDTARSEVVEIIRPAGSIHTGPSPFAPRAKKVLELARRGRPANCARTTSGQSTYSSASFGKERASPPWS